MCSIDRVLEEDPGEVVPTGTVYLCGGDLASSGSCDVGTELVCSKCGGTTVLDWRLGLFDGLTCRRGMLGTDRRKS